MIDPAAFCDVLKNIPYSGISNAVNPLLSLADKDVYSIKALKQ